MKRRAATRVVVPANRGPASGEFIGLARVLREGNDSLVSDEPYAGIVAVGELDAA